MVPDPLRPPPPAGSRPRPPKDRRWIVATVLGLLAIGLPATLLVMRDRSDASPRAWEAADAFVHGITLGTGVESGSGGKTGFEVAYDILSARKREELPFDVFFEDWRRTTDSRGTIV